MKYDRRNRCCLYGFDFVNQLVYLKLITVTFSYPQLVCIIVENEEDVAAFKDYQPPAEEATPTASSAPATEAAPSQPPPPPPPPQATPTSPPSTPPPPPPTAAAARGAAGRIFASPFAKTLAAEQGVNLQVCDQHNTDITRLIEIVQTSMLKAYCEAIVSYN